MKTVKLRPQIWSIIPICVIVAVVYFFVERRYVEERIETESDAASAAASVARSLVVQELSQVPDDALLEQIAMVATGEVSDLSGFHCVVVFPDRVDVSSFRDSSSAGDSLPREIVDTVFSSGEPYHGRAETSLGDSIVAVLPIVDGGGQTIGVVAALSTVDEFDQDLLSFRLAIVGTIGFLLLALCVLIILGARWSQALEEQAQEIADQNRRLAQRAEEIDRAREHSETARHLAEQASEAKSLFLANMSHELRTPLNAIIGYSELLAEEAEDEGADELLADAQKINAAGRHLLSLINDILDISKIEAGKMKLDLQTFDVAELLAEVESTIRPTVEEAQNSFVIESDASGSMRADRTKLRQVLYNLLSNASKFTKDGTVTLRIKDIELGGRELISFEIVDTGIGISAPKLDTLFEAFTQADASTTRKFGGTGLGLTISRQFCRMMGGDLEVDSVVGEGSTFTAYIPRNVKEPQKTGLMPAVDVPREAAKLPEPATDDDRPLVLIIDDDTRVHELLGRTLHKNGYRVKTASSGAEGVEQARALRPNVITLDVMMPQMDGWAVLAELKSDDHLAEIPVVMVTMVGDREVGLSLGAADYLVKPVDRTQLLSTVRAPLSRWIRRLRSGRGRRSVRTRPGQPVAGARRLGNGHREQRARGDGCTSPIQPVGRATRPDDAGMDGFDVLQEMHADEVLHEIPVVVVTAMNLEDHHRKQLNGRVAEIIQKADDSQPMLARIRQIVAEVERKVEDSL